MTPLPTPRLKFAAAGTLEVTVTYLEMLAKPELPRPPAPAIAYRIDRVERPSVPFYRYLYNTVGAPWLWHERRKMNDAELEEVLADPNLWLYVIYAEGEPAGYAELDARKQPEIELAYFGIVPKFIGHRLGPTLLRAAVDMAWQAHATRFWVHTCSLDHPKALPCYVRAGLVPYKEVVRRIRDPRPLQLNI